MSHRFDHAQSAPQTLIKTSVHAIAGNHTAASISVILAGCTFTAASATTNFFYGIGKSPDLSQQIIWGAMAIAASVALALAPFVILRAITRRNAFGALAGIVAFALFGAYSLTGALGSAFGVRAASHFDAVAVANTRDRLQTAYAAAQAELAALPATRPIGELEANILRLKATPGANGCAKEPDGPISIRVCRQVGLDAIELGRAQRRHELEQAASAFGDRLSTLPSARMANADATALSDFAGIFGFNAAPEQVNSWLALLAVLLLEFGGGLCFAICGLLMAETLAAQSAGAKSAAIEAGAIEAETAQEPSILDGPAGAEAELESAAAATAAANAAVAALSPAQDLPTRFMALVKSYGSDLLGSNRSFATALGCSPSEANDALNELASTGAVSVTRSRSGDSLRLAAA